MAPKKNRHIRLSKLLSFAGKHRAAKDDDRVGGPGFSRVVHCNEPEKHGPKGPAKYPSNYISTTKYNVATFFPKALYEQFRRLANCYFLFTAAMSLTPLSPYQAASLIAPLVFVVGLSMAKEALEDYKRWSADQEVNKRKVLAHAGGGTFELKEWRHLQVGEVVKVHKDEFFPADLLLLSSNYPDGVCYVETMNLDGETNLKLRKALERTLALDDDVELAQFQAEIRCEDPNPSLYTFVGNLEWAGETTPIGPQQVLLRDSKLRNTQYVYGCVVFTGHDSKVMQNATAVPSKRSRIEKRIDSCIILLFGVLTVIATVGGVVFGLRTAHQVPDWWYLEPARSTVYYDPDRAALAGVLQAITGLVLYSYLIPISLYVTVEIVKVLQAIFISSDLAMYYAETDTPARARTSNLNEELGQVDTILSDKTGTLTCNQMEFLKCSVGGVKYGKGVTEVERATARRLQKSLSELGYDVDDRDGGNGENGDAAQGAVHDSAAKGAIKGFALKDDRLFNGREYEILNVLEFNSTRKRMSCIVRDPDGRIILMTKGADSVIYERLSPQGRAFADVTKEHLATYGDAGLRTLALAYRLLDPAEYASWNQEFVAAKTSLGNNRDALMEEASERIEHSLTLVGATAVEDKLQHGVPEAIDRLAKAGIKIWVLTGDKVETAINIGYACSLLRQGMTQIVISLDTPEVREVEERGDKEKSREFCLASVAKQLTDGAALIGGGRGPSAEEEEAVYALVIDGKSLEYALHDSLKAVLLALAMQCASVICCRVSPKQKALVTRLVKEGTGKVTLGIGDGANDVGMIQEADIGVGISGVEGQQAVMASDFSIAQFEYLERLLLVHGHWCYKRIASMITYFFYKNIAYGMTIFFFNGYSVFSGQIIYESWYSALYNVFFTSLPVIALGVLEQDVSAKTCLAFPILYSQGPRNVFFSWKRILGWMINGLYVACVSFWFAIAAYDKQALRKSGQVADLAPLGVALYTAIVWTVNVQMALIIDHYTWIHHLFIWGSIVLYYLFAIVYGFMPVTYSTTAYKVFTEELAPSPIYWLTTLLLPVAALLPYFLYKVVQTQLYPLDHQIVQELSHIRKADVEDPSLWAAEGNRAVLPTSIGFSSSVDAVVRRMHRKGKLGRKGQKPHRGATLQAALQTAGSI
eukprot:jgi/Mesen1/6400/ME000329S05566